MSSGQILSCEYTVHPRWLNDSDGAENLWPENMPKQSSQDEMELVEDEVVIEEPAPIDFDWVEERETEEAGTEDIIFEQDILVEEEVIIGAEVSDFNEIENSDCYNYSQSSQENSRDDVDDKKYSNDLDDAYVPESRKTENITEVIASKLDKTKRPTVKFKQSLMVSKNLLMLNQRNFSVDPRAGTSLLKSDVRIKGNVGQVSSEFNNQNADSKFKVRVKMVSRTAKSLKKQIKQKYRTQTSNTKEKLIGRHLESIRGKARKFVDIHGENITINHDVDESKPVDVAQVIDSQSNSGNSKVCKRLLQMI